MEYLELRNRFVGGEFPDGTPITAAGKHVVIIGGGDTGADCLGNSHREQPASRSPSSSCCPSRRPTRPDDLTPWPRWPLILRTSGAHEEGGDRRYSVMTTHLTGEDGRSSSCTATRSARRRSSRRSRAREFTIDADLVLLAMGFLHPQHEGVVEQLGVELDGRGNVADDDFATTCPACSPPATRAAASR